MQTRFVVMASALVGVWCIGARAMAQTSEDEASKQRTQQMEEMQKQLDALKAKVEKLEAHAAAEGKKEAKPPKGFLTFYGHFDLSFDVANKGIAGRVSDDPVTGDGVRAVGAVGWFPAIASNSSYLGIRGGRNLVEDGAWKVIFQVEAQVDVAATPGVSATNFHDDAVVKGALAFRTSYAGFSGPFGALKLGKTDTPYYTATSVLNPFVGTVGTYTSQMGNTGGDNRVEFAYRVAHAIWWESPVIDGTALAILYSPGQNLNGDNLIQPMGEPGCQGGYAVSPLQSFLCNDGAFGDAWSAAISTKQGPLYASAAWEWHKRVNRSTDELFYGGASPDGSIGIANEYAWKLAALYTLPTRTKVGGAFERLYRHNDYVNQDFNERDRFGFWVLLVQGLTKQDELDLGWAHAGKTPGDVGTRRHDGTVAAGPVDNRANMVTALIRHSFLDGQPSIYAVYARQMNETGAHYDLGAGNHGLQYDCHDGNPVGLTPNTQPTGTPGPTAFGAGGRCWTGSTLQAFSVGMTYNF
jgi:predicted porin